MAPTTLVELREERVAKCPNSLAVIAGTRRATYAEVDRSASDLAVELRSRGVGPETLGGVCLDRSAELVVALSGALKAGGAYVPLDPGYPADRLRYLVSDSGVRLVVTDAAHSDSPLFGAGVEAVPVGSGQAPASDPSQAQAETSTAATSGTGSGEPQPHHLAYVIYTSGSTGKPKGVAITHANITSFLEWNQRVCHLGGRDRALVSFSALKGASLQLLLRYWVYRMRPRCWQRDSLPSL